MRIRFFTGAFAVLLLLAAYCMNVSHSWSEGVGALPRNHVNWLPASAWQEGTLKSFGMAAALLAVASTALHLRRKHAEGVMTILTGLSAVTSLAVIGQRLSPRPFQVFELTGFFPYENHFAAFANLVLPVALCMGMRHRIRAFESGKLSSPSGIFFCAAGLMYVAIYFSGSRAGFVIACVVSGAALLQQVRLHRRHPQIVDASCQKLVKGAAISAGLLLVPALIYAASQFRRLGEELGFRGQVLLDTLAMWKDNPFWGSGPGTFSAIFPYYQSLPAEKYSFLHAHCEPLQFLAEYGLFGGLILVAGTVCVLTSRKSKGSRTESSPAFAELEGVGLWLALAGIGLHSLVDFPFRHPLNALLAAVWVGILAGRSSRRYRSAKLKRRTTDG